MKGNIYSGIPELILLDILWEYYPVITNPFEVDSQNRESMGKGGERL